MQIKYDYFPSYCQLNFLAQGPSVYSVVVGNDNLPLIVTIRSEGKRPRPILTFYSAQQLMGCLFSGLFALACFIASSLEKVYFLQSIQENLYFNKYELKENPFYVCIRIQHM